MHILWICLSWLIGLILPPFTARLLLPFVHGAYKSICGRSPPTPGTYLWRRHYGYLYASIVFLISLCNMYAGLLSIAPNYYEMLGISPRSDEATLKSAFRQFAKKAHPDRVGPEGESFFIEVRDAFEALKNPVTRFAYDRFGSEALKWHGVTTESEYIRYGLLQSAGHHIWSLGLLLLVTLLGKRNPSSFWRFVLFFATVAYELAYILSPSLPMSSSPLSLPSSSTWSPISFLFSDASSSSHTTIFSLFWPNSVTWQHVMLLHHATFLMGSALTTVLPVFYPAKKELQLDPKELVTELTKIHNGAHRAYKEATDMTNVELHSAHGEPSGMPPTGATLPSLPDLENPAEQVLDLISKEIENLLIERRLFMEGGPMKSAVEKAIRRRQREEVEKERNVRQSLGSPARFGPSTPRRSFGTPAKGPGDGYVRGRSISY